MAQRPTPLDGPNPMNRLYLACYNRGNNPVWKLLLCTPITDQSGLGTTYGIIPRPNWQFAIERATSIPYARVLLTEVNTNFSAALPSQLASVDISGIRWTQEWVWRALEYLQEYAGYYGFIRKTDDLNRAIQTFLARPPYQPGQVATLDARGVQN